MTDRMSHVSVYTQYRNRLQQQEQQERQQQQPSSGAKADRQTVVHASVPSVARTASDWSATPSAAAAATTAITSSGADVRHVGGEEEPLVRSQLKRTPEAPRVRESLVSHDLIRSIVSSSSSSRVNDSKSSASSAAASAIPPDSHAGHRHQQQVSMSGTTAAARVTVGNGSGGSRSQTSWQSKSGQTFATSDRILTSHHNNRLRQNMTESCSSRLFQTPSQTIPTSNTGPFDPFLPSSASGGHGSEGHKSKRLQATGLLDRIKSLQLTTAIGELDEDEDDDDEERDCKNRNGKSPAVTANPVPGNNRTDSNLITIVPSANREQQQQRRLPAAGDEEDRGCRNSGNRYHTDRQPDARDGDGQNSDQENEGNESVMLVDERPNNRLNIPVHKKFTLLNHESNSRSKTADSALFQTTIDRYFHRIGSKSQGVGVPSHHQIEGKSESCKTRITTVSPSATCDARGKETRDEDYRGKEEAGKSVGAENGLNPRNTRSGSKSTTSAWASTPAVATPAPDAQEVISVNRKSPVHASQVPLTTQTPVAPAVTPSSRSGSKNRRSKSETHLPSVVKETIHSLQKSSSKDSVNRVKRDDCELKRLKIRGKTYFLLSLLGQGGSAKVYQVYDPASHQNLAVKVVDLSVADESVRAGYENEVSLLKRLSNCQRVVRLLDYERVTDRTTGRVKRLFLVMEKGDTDLGTVLKQLVEKDSKSRTGFSLDPLLVRHYFKEMTKAVHEIHEQDVVHSDLKPVNFIIVSGKLKLIDFGIANAIQSDMTSVFKDTQIGTINYMAPESLLPLRPQAKNPLIKFNCKADIWSLGCILYNLVYGKAPFSHLPTLCAKVHAICDKNYDIEFPAHPDAHLVDCLKRCLNRDPLKRPTAKELLQHPYLSGTPEVDSLNPQTKSLVQQINRLTPNRMQVLSRFVDDLTSRK